MSDPSTTAASDARPTILLIDDDKAVLQTLLYMLEEQNFNVATAHDGLDGLKTFRKVKPDIVVTDIIMPEQDGIGAIMTMRHERPNIRIIAISGGGRVGNSDFLSIAQKLGADTTLAKPFEDADLFAAIDTVWARERSHPAQFAVA
jgi:DNA-binding response OmpR family regulator